MSEQKKTKRGLFGFFSKKKAAEESQPAVSDDANSSEAVSTPEDSNDNEILEHHVEPEAIEAIIPAVESELTNEPEPTATSIPESIEAIAEDTEQLKPVEVDTSLPESTEHSAETIIESAEDLSDAQSLVTDEPQAETPQKTGFFGRLKAGLSKTRSNFSEGLANIVLGSKQIDDELLEDIETQLLMADVGVDATRKIITELTQMSARKELKDADALMVRLQELLSNIIKPCAKPLVLDKKPYVILMVGINGVGKTTTIGKLAKKFQQEGKSVMLAAGDTFRAAAVEQLQVWGERNDIHVTAQHTGADSASVIFDALQAAQARNVDVLIADTAGRLHTKSNLMDELSKVKRVMQKLDIEAPHEVMLVVDAGTGQNAINQAEHFHKAVGLTGISISKLDGTAKGGVIFALADKMQIPIRFIGVGEGIDDLREFDADDFIRALFTQSQTAQS